MTIRYDRSFGVAAPELGWVPSPNFALRRAAILDWMKGMPPGRVLEVGCGAGALLYELARRGFNGLGVETSDAARSVAGRILAGNDSMAIAATLPAAAAPAFDYLMAFEVLEHVERDRDALADWIRHLKPAGTVFLSLPAHRRRWNETDLAAGHFRRYDRPDAVRLVEDAGLRIRRIGTCGWPASRPIEWLRLWATRRALRRQHVDAAGIGRGDRDRTAASGIDRRLESRLYPFYASMPMRWAFDAAMALQRPFYDTSLGVSFLVVARKP